MADWKYLGKEKSHRDIQYRVLNPKGRESRGWIQRKQGMIPEGRVGSGKQQGEDHGQRNGTGLGGAVRLGTGRETEER